MIQTNTLNKVDKCIKLLKDNPNIAKKEIYKILNIDDRTCNRLLLFIKERYGIEYKKSIPQLLPAQLDEKTS